MSHLGDSLSVAVQVVSTDVCFALAVLADAVVEALATHYFLDDVLLAVEAIAFDGKGHVAERSTFCAPALKVVVV